MCTIDWLIGFDWDWTREGTLKIISLLASVVHFISTIPWPSYSQFTASAAPEQIDCWRWWWRRRFVSLKALAQLEPTESVLLLFFFLSVPWHFGSFVSVLYGRRCTKCDCTVSSFAFSFNGSLNSWFTGKVGANLMNKLGGTWVRSIASIAEEID